MFRNYFKNKFYSNFNFDSISHDTDTSHDKDNDNSNKFEKLLYQDNDNLHKEIIRAYANYMISYTPRAFKSNTYEKLKSNPEYYKDFDSNKLKPYSLKEFAFKFHSKAILDNTSNDFKKKQIEVNHLIENNKESENTIKSIDKNEVIMYNENKSTDINNKIDYVQYKRLLIESKRSHFFNCVVQFLFLNNYPIYISK